jgi:FO synthase
MVASRPAEAEAFGLLGAPDWRQLAPYAAALRDEGFGSLVTYSRKVFAPLTHLCRDVCHYCTFARPPRRGERAFMSEDEVLALAEAGAKAGCKEMLFTLGDKPEARYGAAREALAGLGHETTLSYLETVARRVVEETGLLPHLNPGLLAAEAYRRLRAVAPSMGIMLETASERLSARGGPHFGSPDKWPSLRLAAIDAAGAAMVPLTTGILIGIGETREERIESLLAIRRLNEAHGHIQEIIIQNFRAKPGTRMSAAPEPPAEDLLWTIAVSRLIFGAHMSLQAPPNLYSGPLSALIEAGINDWGGVSPVTPDHVNPEAPWPHLDHLADETACAGKHLTERLTVYPRFIEAREVWIDAGLHKPVLRLSDGVGLARPGRFVPGSAEAPDAGDLNDMAASPRLRASNEIRRLADRAESGRAPSESEIATLFAARGADFAEICAAADRLRQATVGETVSYVVNRNINYTNICAYHCGFCAFSKGKTAESLRGKPYLVDLAEIRRRVREAWDRGATEVCLQGGIHPAFTGETYLSICRAAKEEVPQIHVHAFSPLEVAHGAATLKISVPEFLKALKSEGLGTLPGTAAEILDDEIRAEICPDKLSTQEWLDVIAAAHGVGLKTTSTIMFGHLEGYRHWARHLIRIRALQEKTGGITEFVPLPFVPMEAPIYLKGKTRRGPSLREAILMHAVARLALYPFVPNIQVSWVKLGPEGALRCLSAGANDLGGTLMNESISRAAGAAHGQELDPRAMEEIIARAGRSARQRTTLYAPASAERCNRARQAAPLSDPVNTLITRENFKTAAVA